MVSTKGSCGSSLSSTTEEMPSSSSSQVLLSSSILMHQQKKKKRRRRRTLLLCIAVVVGVQVAWDFIHLVNNISSSEGTTTLSLSYSSLSSTIAGVNTTSSSAVEVVALNQSSTTTTPSKYHDGRGINNQTTLLQNNNSTTATMTTTMTTNMLSTPPITTTKMVDNNVVVFHNNSTNNTNTSSGNNNSSSMLMSLLLVPIVNYCGNGTVGNGVCYDGISCCSQYGYCRLTSAHCGGPRGTCGMGKRGNGRCPLQQHECCSRYGWCGHTNAHCLVPPPVALQRPAATAAATSTKKKEAPLPSFHYCGNGRIGNGLCRDGTSCCSSKGFCGTSDEHCKPDGTCGNGTIGNRRCPHSQKQCCSSRGDCGTTNAHCTSPKYVFGEGVDDGNVAPARQSNNDTSNRILRIAHVISPFDVTTGKNKTKSSTKNRTQLQLDYDRLFHPNDQAQNVTLGSMIRAYHHAGDNVQVSLFCAVFPEDQHVVPNTTIRMDLTGEEPRSLFQTILLNRSTATEYPNLKPPIKLPFIHEILQSTSQMADQDSAGRMLDRSLNRSNIGGYDFLIFSNSDIGLTKYFYRNVGAMINKYGFDAFTVNRVTVPSLYRPSQPSSNASAMNVFEANVTSNNNSRTLSSLQLQKQIEDKQWLTGSEEDLATIEQLMVSEGRVHPGIDCFVLSRSIVQSLFLGDLVRFALKRIFGNGFLY